MSEHRWQPGDRVQWKPTHTEPDYQKIAHGTVADAEPWPPVDQFLAPGARIPVDLDEPILAWQGGSAKSRPCVVRRLYVREQFLERVPEATDA